MHERSFRVICRHRSTADYSLDGDMVDGATVVGRDPALFNWWTHGFFTSECLLAWHHKAGDMLNGYGSIASTSRTPIKTMFDRVLHDVIPKTVHGMY